MRSILQEFAYGNITPNDQSFKKNSAFGEAMKALTNNEEKLLARLGGDDKEIFQKYIDAQGEVNRLTAVKNLIYGYNLGLLMTAEAFLQSGELISGEREES